MKKVSLTQFTETSLKEIWKQGFSSDHPEWTKFNAPYLMIIRNLLILNHSKKAPLLNFY
jgi:hypothetical protein